MNKATSVYLDVVRISAALVVFLDHADGKRLTGGLFWRFSQTGAEAVVVFFVLSGFVIFHTASTREISLQDYAVARAARIYSVVLPALAMTAAADFLGRQMSPALYTTGVYDSGMWDYLKSILFLNEVWWQHASPGSDWSYWSLGYEVWYYVIFAAFFYAGGRWRVALTGAFLAIIGPGIAAMFPLWLLGGATYKICKEQRIKPQIGWVLFVASLVLWAIYEFINPRIGRFLLPSGSALGIWTKREELPQDYLIALFFSMNLIGFRALSEGRNFHLSGFWRMITWLAGATFSLYLFHPPLLLLFATINPWGPGSVYGRVLVVGGTLLAIFLLAEVSERRKRAWRRGFASLLSIGRTA